VATCAAASDAVLRSVVRTPFRSRVVAGLYTVEMAAPPAAPALVLLHGYCMGSAMWCLALDGLAARFRVLAVDMRGCGASARPAWPAAARGARRLSVGAGEAWFTESLEAWRAEMGLERAAVLGHSLGGYVAAAYALRHPDRVSHLVLASPAGVPPPPAADASRQTLTSSHWATQPLSWAWDGGLTLQALFGAVGPAWARSSVGGAFDARFGPMIAAHPRAANLDRRALREYLWSINAVGRSGDSALPVFLKFSAYARDALGPRLERAAAAQALPFPVTFIHGAERDWMPPGPSLRAAAALRVHGVDADFLLTPRAGHNLHLQNPDVFVRQVLGRVH